MARYYDIKRPDGSEAKYASVTTILQVLPKAEALKKWMDETPDYARHMRNRATIGTLIHWRIQRYLAKKHHLPPEPLRLDCTIITPEMKEAIDIIWSYFIDADDTISFKPIYLEKQIVNHEYQYAGTADYIGKVNGKNALLDFKTFKRLYDNHNYGAQLSAYRRGIDYKIEELYILRINEETAWELIPIADDWNTFLEALELYKRSE